jgi:hypothetical protein
MRKNSHSESESVFNAFLAPSGMFTCNFAPSDLPRSELAVSIQQQPDQNAGVLIFNPYHPDVRSSLIDKSALDRQTLFLDEYRRVQKIKCLDLSEFEDYALTLFADLIPNLLHQKHDVILFPLRGCRQPGIITKVLVGLPNEKAVIFNYTYATADFQQEMIRSELIEQLNARLPNVELANIGVVDTAKGGDSSIHLAAVLEKIQAEHFSGQQWSVQFHLLHDRARTQDLYKKLYRIHGAKTGHSTITFPQPLLYAVDSLIVEDWDDGIGISTYRDGTTYQLKKAETPGRLIVRDDTAVSLIESSDLSKVVTGLMVDAVNELMLNDPDVKYVCDVLEKDARSSDMQKGEI